MQSSNTELRPEQLARQCQAGRRDAFDALVALFSERIYHFLVRCTGNTHDAEDLTQETFVKAYQHIDRFDPALSFSTWLFTIAKRMAANHWRALKPTIELPAETGADLHDPALALEHKDAEQSIWRLAQQLKPNQYQALWLRYAEDFSIADIARIMQTNQIYVKVLLHRGRSALAKKIGQLQTQTVSEPCACGPERYL